MIHSYLDYLLNLKKFRIDLKLEHIQKFMQVLDNPQHSYKTIHVAGTNGKGSTSSFIATILQKAGYKVGLYTSPHVVKFNERIKINGENISDDKLIKLVDNLKNKVETNNIKTSFFEFTTALMFSYFVQEQVDIAIIEVGLGGRLDATNVIIPEVSVITNISIDHTNFLGSTIAKIAKEKAGIIKENIPLVTTEINPEALEVFLEVCKNKNASMYQVPNDTHYKISLQGDHQQRNASLAVETIKHSGLEVSKESLEEGLKDTKWLGRLQIISENPKVIVDCAHNVAGIKALANYLQTIPGKKTLLLGISQGKEVEEMVKIIAPLFEKIIVTEGNFKPTPADELAEIVSKRNSNTIAISNSKEAVTQAIKQDGNLVVAGSIYLVGDVLPTLKQLTNHRIENIH